MPRFPDPAPLLLLFCVWWALSAQIWAETAPGLQVVSRTWYEIPVTPDDSITGFPSHAGVTNTLTFDLANPGDSELDLGGFRAGEAVNCRVAVLGAAPTRLGPHASATLVLTYPPLADGTWSAIIAIGRQAGVPFRWRITGVAAGAPPRAVVADRDVRLRSDGVVVAPNSVAGRPLRKDFIISNVGTGYLQITGVMLRRTANCSALLLGAPDYLAFLPGRESDQLGLWVTPTGVGPWSVEVTVLTNDPALPSLTIHQTGEAAPALPGGAN